MPNITVVAPLVVTKVGVGAPEGSVVTVHASPASEAIGLPNWSVNVAAGNCWLAPVTVSAVPW